MDTTKRHRIITALSGLVDLLADGDGEVFFLARVSPDRMDEIAAAGAELEDLEDDGTAEPDTAW